MTEHFVLYVAALVVVGVAAGYLGGLFGIGGGVILVPTFLTLFPHLGAQPGYVDGLAFVVIAPIVMIAAPLGARTASRAPELVLKWIYVALLLGIAAYMTTRTV